MGYSDNASRHQGVDREARYFSSLLAPSIVTIRFLEKNYAIKVSLEFR